jgi:hypothetical protein
MPCSKQVIVLTAVRQLVLVSDSAEVVVVSYLPVAPTVGRLLPLDLGSALIAVERWVEACHSNQGACRSNRGGVSNSSRDGDSSNSSRGVNSNSRRGGRRHQRDGRR